jgi:DNA-binding NarL/FixJ family response regulator
MVNRVGLATGDRATKTPTFEVTRLRSEINAERDRERESSTSIGFIALIERSPFLRECIRRSMQPSFSMPVAAYSTLSELEQQLGDDLDLKIIVLSVTDFNDSASADALTISTKFAPNVPVIVLGAINDIEIAKTAIRYGAKGYIPSSMNFEIALEAIRFVLAGGTYAPTDYLLSSGLAGVRMPLPPSHNLTAREKDVIRAIQEGESNKVIAAKLNLSVSTVKIHVRSVMHKLKAKNRTEVAMMTHAAQANS